MIINIDSVNHAVLKFHNVILSEFILVCQFGHFVISCTVLECVTMGHHSLPYTLLYIVLYNYGNFVSFLTVTNFITLPEVLLNALTNIFSKMRTKLSIFRRVTIPYHHFLIKRYQYTSFVKT